MFGQVWIGEIENKMPKMLKNKKEIVNNGILLKFSISIISIFLKKKTIALQNFLVNPRIHTIKQHKNFNFFFENQ